MRINVGLHIGEARIIPLMCIPNLGEVVWSIKEAVCRLWVNTVSFPMRLRVLLSTKPTSTEWETSGSGVLESHKLFCSHYYCPVSPMAGLVYFFPGFHRRKKVKFPPLTNSSKSPFLDHPLFLKLQMVMKCVWLFYFLLTHIKLEEMAWSQRKAHNLALTPNFTFIFVWSKESSLSFGNAALSSFSILCLFLAALSWEQAW